MWAAAFIGLAALAGTGWGAWTAWNGSTIESAAVSGGLDPHRIAVLYFEQEDAGDSLGYVADGLTEGLIRELGQVAGLQVISKGGVAQYRGEGLTRDSVGRALEAGTLVTGSVDQAGGRLRVNARLVDGASGADFGRVTFEQPFGNLLAVQDTLAQKVAGLIRERLGEEIRLRAQRNRTRNVQAWSLVQRAELARKRAEALVEQKDTTGALAQGFETADTLYAQAHQADPEWAEPLVGRAAVAYRRSRLVGFDAAAAKPWIDKGKKFADEALALSPQDPDAMELRGTLRYWGWLLHLEPDARKADQLLKAAEADLEGAVRVRPSQAGAWAVLGHLYNHTKGGIDAKLAAQRAYEEDAYLANANQVLNRLFIASYDLSQFVDAVHWCEEGGRRFPADFNFAKCQMWLLTTKAKEPDVALAWRLADSVPKLAPVSRQEYERHEALMIVAMVLARAGLADSARAVAVRARGTPEVDPTQTLAWEEIYVRLLLGDRAEALDALKQYLVANPERRAELVEESNWWFRELEDDPRYRAIVGAR